MSRAVRAFHARRPAYGLSRVAIAIAGAFVISSCVSAPPPQGSATPSLASAGALATQSAAGGAGVPLSPKPIPALPQPPPSAAVSERSRAAPRGEPLHIPVDLNRIAFSAADAKGIVHVTGHPGAVPGPYAVYADVVQSGLQARVVSAADGSFAADVPIPDGSTVVVAYGDAAGSEWNSVGLELTVNPLKPRSATEIPFTTGRTDRVLVGQPSDPGKHGEELHWTAKGTANGWSFQPGNTMSYRITFSFSDKRNAPGLDLSCLRAPRLRLGRIANGDGRAVEASYQPVLTTVTGLPIFTDHNPADQADQERPRPPGSPCSQSSAGSQSSSPPRSWPFDPVVRSVHQEGDTITLDVTYSRTVPREMPAGYYVPRVEWSPGSVWREPNYGPGVDGPRESDLPVIRIGEAKEPRLPWTLLGDTLSNGTRGGTAHEDKGSFDLGTKIAYNADRLIVPKNHARTGHPASYRLEPYLPTIGSTIGPYWLVDTPTPLVSFVFPSGELHVSVQRPDGKVDDLGRAPFRAARTTHMYGTSWDPEPFGASSMEQLYQLSTFDPSFEYTFPAYGHYVVTMEGWIADGTGITYRGGGTYDVYVAEVLDLDLGTFLSTPFQVGDVMSPVVHVRPGVPADVSVDLRLYPNSLVKDLVQRTLSGKADHFGYFHPGASASALTLSAPGEYVVDVSASYTDASGVLWMGALRGASVVETPNTTLIAHGRRGVDSNQATAQPVWFVQSNIEPQAGGGGPGRPAPPPSNLFFPYHSGDVIWADATRGGGIAPFVSLQDDRKATLLDRTAAQRNGPPNPVDVGATGEIDVRIPDVVLGLSDGRKMALPAAQYPELITTWGYYYAAAQRPGVTVRSHVASGRADRDYWRFREGYNDQLGVQRDVGDLPGDYKLQYAGIVYRDASASAQYAIYGSLAVMTGSEQQQRAFPPFQGAAGGPSGGPLLTIDGRPVDIFFTPAGVMPGDVLEVGDTFAFSGAIAPTLPSKVDVTLTLPDGTRRSFTERGNKVGHVYDPNNDLVLSAPGRYTLKVTVTHDGMTSAGPLQPPYPTGGILGTRDGTYSFYVVPKGAYLPVDVPARGRLRRDASPFSISAQLPAGLSGATVYRTVDLTGTVLEDSAIGGSRYVYDEAQLSRRFTNLDGGRGAPGDTVVVTLAGVGTDAAGRPTAYARQVLFQGQQVYALAEP